MKWVGVHPFYGDTLKACYRYSIARTTRRPSDFITSDAEKPNTTVFYNPKRQD